VAILAGIAFAATAMPGPVSAEPLRDELILLLAEHPDIRRARNDAAAAKSRIGEARAANLPRFELSADTGAERTDDPTRRAGNLGAFSIRRDKVTLTVTQNLFNGFRDQAGINAAKIGRLEQNKGLENTRQELLFQGISQYLEALRNVRLIKVAQETEKTIRTQLSLEDERVRRGSGIAVDVLQAKSRLQVAKEQRVAFEGRLQEALARYKQLFGHMPDVATLEEGRPSKDLIPDSLATAIRTALQYHPALRQTQYQADIAREQKRIAKADYLPTLDLVGSLDYEKNVATTRGIQREQALLLRARWEFFSGFRTRSRVESAARTLASRKDTLNFAARRVEEDVRIAWDRLLTERRRVDLLENAVNLALEVFNAKRRLREAGKSTALNVLDAEREVSDARIKLITADFDARIAAYLLTRRTGMLTPATLRLADLGTDSVARVPWAVTASPLQPRMPKSAPPQLSKPAPSVAAVAPLPKPVVKMPRSAPIRAIRAIHPPRGSAAAPPIRGAHNSVTLRSPEFGGNDAANSRDAVAAKSEATRSTARSEVARIPDTESRKPAVLRQRMQPLPATPVAVALPPRSSR
jgi:adhesin transport system outer membrane protein